MGTCGIETTITATDVEETVNASQTTRAAHIGLRRRRSLAAACLLSLTPVVAAAQEGRKPRPLTKQERVEFIHRAQVWSPTDVSAMDIRKGPAGKGAFPPDAAVTCDYTPTKKRSGSSRKFECAIGDDVFKVRYGDENGEVVASVLASRLLWALGFYADRVYPARVICRGCSDDPWTQRKAEDGEHVFDLAAIERKPSGHEVETKGGDSSWSWKELSIVDDAAGGATDAQIDALKLLAVMIQHTDTKPEQQRLLCLPGGLAADGRCEKPALALHDVGLTFGHANVWNDSKRGSVNFTEWSRTPVWRDRQACIAHMSKSQTGTLGDPPIGEAGRAFLAGLLQQLTDAQLRDLFTVSRVDRRHVDESTPPASVENWVSAFKQKREEIVSARCPERPAATASASSDASRLSSGRSSEAQSTAPRR
jgi:hypothetical protein